MKPGFASVVTDIDDGSRQVIQDLSAPGHRHIAYLGGPRNAWSDGQRWWALSAYAAAADVTIVNVGPFSPTLEQGAAATDAGLASGATALVAFNDLLAIGSLRRLEHGASTSPAESAWSGTTRSSTQTSAAPR